MLLNYQLSIINYQLLIVLCFCVFVSCTSKKTDLREFIPADTLIYLETNDLGKTLGAVTESEAFRIAAKTRTNFAAVEGVQLAVAVTGFEASKRQVTSEDAVLNFQPKFVAVSETRAWNFQVLNFAENKLGEFVNERLGGEVQLETFDRHGGKYFLWTSPDERKMHALVRGSLVFFGNDEAGIEKCLAAKRGEISSITKNAGLLRSNDNTLANGFVSADGIPQISSLAGVFLAHRASDESEVVDFIARVLPDLLRNSVNEIVWTAEKHTNGIEDKFTIKTNTEVSAILSETLVSSGERSTNLANYVPADSSSVTRYDLANPQIAWRSVLLVTQKQTDEVSGKIIAEISGNLFEPYGIADAETFLSAINGEILTAKLDTEDKAVAIVTIKDEEKIKTAISREIDLKKAEKIGSADVFKSADAQLSAAFIENKLIIGDSEGVTRCLQTKENLTNLKFYQSFTDSRAVAVTIGKDTDSAGRIAEVLAEKTSENPAAFYLTETRFNQNGIERRTISDFGFIRSLIELLDDDE